MIAGFGTQERRREIERVRGAREARIMNVIRDSLRKRKRPPSIREITDAAEISSTSVTQADLRRLELKGLLRLATDTSTRGIELVLGPDDSCPFCGGKPCERP